MSKDNFNTQTTAETTNVWLTPRWLLDKLGKFDLDPCAAMVRPWDCADVNYTEADNGLLLPWKGRVWCNPPYGKQAEAFMQRMSQHLNGLALVFVRTDTRWFHDSILSSACGMFLLRGRIRFCRADGSLGDTPNAPSCLVTWTEKELPLLRSLEKEGLGRLAVFEKGAANDLH